MSPSLEEDDLTRLIRQEWLALDARAQWLAALAEAMRQQRWLVIHNHPTMRGQWELNTPPPSSNERS